MRLLKKRLKHNNLEIKQLECVVIQSNTKAKVRAREVPVIDRGNTTPSLMTRAATEGVRSGLKEWIDGT